MRNALQGNNQIPSQDPVPLRLRTGSYFRGRAPSEPKLSHSIKQRPYVGRERFTNSAALLTCFPLFESKVHFIVLADHINQPIEDSGTLILYCEVQFFFNCSSVLRMSSSQHPLKLFYSFRIAKLRPRNVGVLPQSAKPLEEVPKPPERTSLKASRFLPQYVLGFNALSTSSKNSSRVEKLFPSMTTWCFSITKNNASVGTLIMGHLIRSHTHEQRYLPE